MMKRIFVRAGGGYEVLIGSGLVQSAGERIAALLPDAGQIALVTDWNVREAARPGEAADRFKAPLPYQLLKRSLREAGFSPGSCNVPGGEAAKTGAAYLELLEYLADRAFTRSDLIVAVGGGAVGDLAGFAAATYLRGIPLVQIPTTLLAMADASVGGKSAINLAAGKNLAGAIRQPVLVLCDTDFLQSLPPERFADGSAEIIKCGMLGDPALLARLGERPLQLADAEALEDAIAAAVQQKAALVEADERDEGDRQLLNFGHTFGHAIELCSGYEIPHGSAVAIGMVMMTRAAIKQGLCAPDCLPRLAALLQAHGLPTEAACPAEALCAAILHDKKRRAERMTLVVPREWGRCTLHHIQLETLPAWAKGAVDA